MNSNIVLEDEETESKMAVVLFSCDKWKTISSMKLIGVYTDEQKLASEIIFQVGDGAMYYGGNLEDIHIEDVNYVNNRLDFGYLQEVFLNEKQ